MTHSFIHSFIYRDEIFQLRSEKPGPGESRNTTDEHPIPAPTPGYGVSRDAVYETQPEEDTSGVDDATPDAATNEQEGTNMTTSDDTAEVNESHTEKDTEKDIDDDDGDDDDDVFVDAKETAAEDDDDEKDETTDTADGDDDSDAAVGKEEAIELDQNLDDAENDETNDRTLTDEELEKKVAIVLEEAESEANTEAATLDLTAVSGGAAAKDEAKEDPAQTTPSNTLQLYPTIPSDFKASLFQNNRHVSIHAPAYYM